MKAYLAAAAALALCAGAAASALSACATGADVPPTTNGFTPGTGSSTSSSSGGSSSSGSGTPDATVMPSGSGGYGDDSSNPSGSSGSSGGSSSSGGDDGGGQPTPGPTCAPGQACVDGIPSGWNGFVQLLLQSGATAPGCAAPYDSVQPQLGGQTNPDGGPATCGACSCTLPEAGVSCSILVENDNTGCLLLGTESDTTVVQNACTKLAPALSGANGHVGTPSVWMNSAQCTPQGGTPTTAPPPPTSTTAVACAQSDAGAAGEGGAAMTCLSGQACASLPVGADAGTPSGVCVYQAGVQTCPPGGTSVFTNTFVVGALEDSRGCGCTCGDPSCPGDGYVAGFTNSGCTGTPTYTFDAGAKCAGSITGANRPTYVFYHPTRSGSLGTCGAATGGPSGGVDIDAGTATTFCCVP